MEQTKRLYDKRSFAEVLSISTATISRRMKDDEHFPKPKVIFGKCYWTDIQLNEYVQFINNDGYSS